jgi:ERCC4-type nuclease
MSTIIIDTRERDLIEVLSNTPLGFQIESLDIGDIKINDATFERKTLADLESSVKDGRYREQKQRALANGIELTYIIEGSKSFSYSDASPTSKMLTGCVINTLVRDRIPIVFTRDLAETIKFIECLAQRMAADPSKYAPTTSPSKPYAASICLKKKENVDPAMCFILQLSCIPGISSKKAQDISKTHSITNMAAFIALLETMDAPTFAKMTPGIGKTLAKTIRDFLMV